MKLLLILALVAAVVARPDEGHYSEKYDNFDVDAVIENVRLLKSYAHCFIGDGKCTPEGKEIKGWIAEASKSSCGKCTEKQKVLVAKCIKALQEKLPEEFKALEKMVDPEGKYTKNLEKYLKQYAP